MLICITVGLLIATTRAYVETHPLDPCGVDTMDECPSSPDSLSSDQLTVDILSRAPKRRREALSPERRDALTPDLANNKPTANNNDVAFVLAMDDDPSGQQEEDDDVCMIII